MESVRGSDAFVVQSHTAPINQWIMEELIMVDALKRASAKRITVVAPFFGYARQDKKSRAGPISARLMADLSLPRRGPDHRRGPAHRADSGFFRRPGRPPVRAADPGRLRRGQPGRLAGHGRGPGRRPVRVCERWTDRLGSPLAIIHKRRDPDVANKVAVSEVVGKVAGRTCIVVDDMIDTGATIIKAADALFEQGAARSSSPPARRAVRQRGGRAEEFADQRGHRDQHAADPHDSRFDKLTVLSIAPLIARAITEVFSDGSVTSLFDGQS